VSWHEYAHRSRYGFICSLVLGTLNEQRRWDCKYLATVSRGEVFFALEAKVIMALDVSVEGEKIEVYAVMSVGGLFVNISI